MPKHNVSLGERMARIRKAALPGNEYLRPAAKEELPDLHLSDRVAAIAALLSHFFQQPHTFSTMMAFIAYDIENNKIRTLIAKHLIEKGCIRVQKSVYFLECEIAVYRQLITDLKVVQEMYDNQDSIFFLPVGKDMLNKFQFIGRELNLELALHNPNTLFI